MNKIFQKISSSNLWTIGIVFFALGFSLYGNILKSPFIWDDQILIVNNIIIQDWKNLPQYFSQYLFSGAGAEGDYWRPLQTISFSFDYSLGGLNPFVYHMVNVLWHILASVLAYMLFFKIFKNKPAAFFTALFFLIHPLQTEAVTYVSGRADSMLAVFLFSSFLFFLKYTQKNSKGALFFSFLFLCFSFFTKERAVLFFAIIFLYLFTIFPREISWNWKKKIFSTLPFIMITIIYIVLRRFFLPVSTDGLSFLKNPDIMGTFEIFLKFTGTYVELFIFPIKLFMQRPINVSGFFDLQVVFGFLFLMISVLGFILSFKKKRIWSFGIGWFWIFFIFSFFSFLRMGFLMEHWLYIPMLGILAPFFIFFTERIINSKSDLKKNAALVFLLLIIFLFSFRTIIRNSDWRDPVRFYEKNIAAGSSSAQIYNNLGMEYFNQGKSQKAIYFFNQAANTDSRLPGPWYNSAMIYEDAGMLEMAEKHYLFALERDPKGIPIYEGLQAVYNAQGKIDEAIYITEESLKVEPNNSFMLANLGIFYQAKGDLEKASFYLKKAVDLEPENKDYSNALKEITKK